jgi:hypothetical protein
MMNTGKLDVLLVEDNQDDMDEEHPDCYHDLLERRMGHGERL